MLIWGVIVILIALYFFNKNHVRILEQFIVDQEKVGDTREIVVGEGHHDRAAKQRSSPLQDSSIQEQYEGSSLNFFFHLNPMHGH